MTTVGKELDRVDARLKVTGKATYAAETPVANVAHAVIAGSAIARGGLLGVDTRAARRAPGVLAVITPDTAPALPGARPTAGTNDRVLQLLQDDTIHYADQPIAVVVADTLEHAQAAAHLLVPRYDRAEPVAELEQDLPAAYVPAKAGPSAAPTSRRGDVEAGLATAAVTVAATYTTPIHTHNAMEPHATVAVWEGADRLTVYDSTQGIFNVRNRLAQIFGLAPERVRVISHFIGGGFGSKGSPWSHVPLAAMAARVVGRPVKLVVTRSQMASLVGRRPHTLQTVSVGCTARGQLTAIRHDVVSETSRFDEFTEAAALQSRMLYACANVETTHKLVRIDVPTPTFTRAPGHASGSFALESAMDELAYAAGIDPLELRLRNHADRDPDEDKPWSSKSLRECYARAAEACMATATYPARQLPASAIARLAADGTLTVQAGTQDIGTGTYTIMTQLAADELAMPPGAVRFELGDTALPETPLSAGSFTASSTGSAVKIACAKLRDKLIALAVADPRSPLRGAPAAEVTADGGALVYRKARDPYAAIVTRTGFPEVAFQHTTAPRPDRDDRSIHAFGAQFVEVAVDPDLGEVRVRRVVSAFGCGRILNPKTARSQLVGGIVWSIGMALTEHAPRDPHTARPVVRDLADYHVPVHADVPAIDVILVDEVDPYVNEIGAKGLGEIGNTGAAAAIANAVYHATGIRIRDLPILPDKLLG
jgi:xanthine dehydrogenase YagR molybdenum-binding subunit